MACMPPFTFLGENVIQDEYSSIEGLGGRGNSVEETTFFSQQSRLKDDYTISEGANAEAKTVNGLSDSAGYCEQGCFLPEGDTFLEEMSSEELVQERKVNHITWEFSNGYILDSDILFVKGAEPEVRKRFRPGGKHSYSSAEGRCELSQEELILSVINREPCMSVLETHRYSLVMENDCFKVTIQVGDNATFIHILENPDSGASRSTNINSDGQFSMQSRTISRPTEEETNFVVNENSLLKLEKMFQHINLSLKDLGIKCDNLFENIKMVAGLEDSSSISSNGMFDFDLHETAEGPPEGLFYVLPYLELRELLALDQVSKSLRDAVRNDVLLWKSLHIEDPLNEKVTDDVLLRLSARAQGRLECLSLLQCERVTGRAVRQVLASNPLLLKLCLPGCTGVSVDAVVAMVKEHLEGKSLNGPCLKQLRISGLYGITREHVDQLHSMLISGNLEPRKPKPQYYRYGHYPVYCEDDRLIDVEVCPKCANVRVVYDCTRDRCQQKRALKLQQCRGCTFCIARCEECGTCIDDIDYEETFCLGLLCSACWLRLPKCVECNRPGCGKHVDHFTGSPAVILLCTGCHGSSLGSNSNAMS
ncbi:hypothetical protein O6H91_04G029700 [Diphasiastrum complanatum]|uniref:Uncharacterized protein n=1 Tax=Diphasiastrum complanatum TaxID=34168 RepID=A0ACC2DVI3_DIPCM|nr:hypothetical protein O6H91_04G029700 [Diphasiastrum complanatum]